MSARMRTQAGKVFVFVAFVVAFVAALAPAAPKAEFSGTYTAQKKNAKANVPPTLLRVEQSESAVEVTRVENERELTNRFPLDGTEGNYTTATGLHGKSKAQFKNDALVLENFVASPPDASGRSLRFHTTETWKLSGDAKSLTIKTEVESPDFPPEVAAAAFPNNPWTETYHRTDKP